MRRRPLAALAALLCACGGAVTDPGGPKPEEQALCQRVGALDAPAPAASLQARRSALARVLGDGVVVLAAGLPNGNPTDNGYRGDANFYYLAGFELPGSWLALYVRAGAVDSVHLYLPEAATDPNAPVLLRERLAATAVRCAARVGSDLRATLLPAGRAVLHASPANPALQDTVLGNIVALGVTPRAYDAAVAALRLVKDSAEVDRLRQAADITARALGDALPAIRAGSSEADVASLIENGFRTRGAAFASFPSIVASGPNALVLHYNANTRTMAAGELLLMDVGAEYARYAGDVTRTFPVSGTFTPRQRALYELVLGAQLAAIDQVRPGVTLAQLEGIARDYLRTRSGSLCGTVTCDTRFVHSLTHWLGLNVHDVGSRSAPLQPGMVLTVEPGIYLPGENIGIRIEDDVLVTAAGYEVLSGAVPKTVAAIEALFAGR